MRRFPAALIVAVACVLIASTAALATPSNDDELFTDELHRLAESQKVYKGGQRGSETLNMEVVGHNNLGGRGYNADVGVHRGYAYVGHWGFTDWATGNDRFCPEPPQSGVAVVDVRNPADPTVVSTLQNPMGTSAEDVTDPTQPGELGFYDSGCCARGVHEFEVEDRSDLGRTFAYVTVPSSEEPDDASPNGLQDEQGRGPFRLLDITDPANPVEVSTWGFLHDGLAPGPEQGCDPDALFGHGAEPSADGKLVFLSYWDSGFVALDVTDPLQPVFRGRTIYPADADGDGHSSSYNDARRLLFTADEDFCKTSGAGIEKGFGYLRVYDYANLAAPVQIGEYRTPNALGTDDQSAGDYTIHNPLVVGTTVYASWYTDGVRVIDVSDPSRPREVAYFVPPAGENPVKPKQRFVLPSTTQVWGVVVDEATGLVFASDMNTGLWILRRTD